MSTAEVEETVSASEVEKAMLASERTETMIASEECKQKKKQRITAFVFL